jgi:hypothetical protein
MYVKSFLHMSKGGEILDGAVVLHILRFDTGMYPPLLLRVSTFSYCSGT